MAKPYLIRVKSLQDLVNVAIAAQVFILHHVELNGKHVYYLPFPSYDSHIIYYYESNEEVKGRYILFNKFTGSMEVSDWMSGDSRVLVIPVVEVLEQDVLPKNVGKKSKKEKKRKKRS